MDDYETHDDRRLLPGTGFTIEPGVYFDDFGVRTEINMIVGARDAAVTGPLQTEIRGTALVRRRTMSTRKTTLFYAAAHRGRLAGRRHGDRVAARSDARLVGADASPCRR